MIPRSSKIALSWMWPPLLLQTVQHILRRTIEHDLALLEQDHALNQTQKLQLMSDHNHDAVRL